MNKEREVLKLALEALEKVTTEMLAIRDELAERGARPTTNVFCQRLWDSSFKAYTDHALPASIAIRESLAQPEQEPFGYFQLDLRLDAWVQNRDSKRGVAFYTTPLHSKPLTPQSPCEMTQAESRMFKLGWLECEAAHGIKD